MDCSINQLIFVINFKEMAFGHSFDIAICMLSHSTAKKKKKFDTKKPCCFGSLKRKLNYKKQDRICKKREFNFVFL